MRGVHTVRALKNRVENSVCPLFVKPWRKGQTLFCSWAGLRSSDVESCFVTSGTAKPPLRTGNCLLLVRSVRSHRERKHLFFQSIPETESWIAVPFPSLSLPGTIRGRSGLANSFSIPHALPIPAPGQLLLRDKGAPVLTSSQEPTGPRTANQMAAAFKKG